MCSSRRRFDRRAIRWVGRVVEHRIRLQCGHLSRDQRTPQQAPMLPIDHSPIDGRELQGRCDQIEELAEVGIEVHARRLAVERGELAHDEEHQRASQRDSRRRAHASSASGMSMLAVSMPTRAARCRIRPASPCRRMAISRTGSTAGGVPSCSANAGASWVNAASIWVNTGAAGSELCCAPKSSNRRPSCLTSTTYGVGCRIAAYSAKVRICRDGGIAMGYLPRIQRRS